MVSATAVCFHGLGRNVQFCSERYGRKVGDNDECRCYLEFIDLDSSSRINPVMHNIEPN